MDNATPRPWKVEETQLSDGFITVIYDADGHRVIELSGPFAKDITALIVRAVNRDALFDEMVAALEQIAEETAATWVSDKCRAILARVREMSG